MTSISAKKVRNWYRIHKWTSLICTAFLLMTCVTGLPLIFHDEIDQALNQGAASAQVAPGTPDANLDAMVVSAKAHFPGLKPLFVSFDDDEPRVFVTMASSFDPKPMDTHALVFDLHTGKQLESTRPGRSLTSILLVLHREMFLGLFGELFTGVIAIFFMIALVSGAIVYGPFMRKLEFGTIRKGRSSKLKWFDLHNLIGIVTLSWALVVGGTGFLNELSTPLFGLWRAQVMPQLLEPYHGKSAPQSLVSVESVKAAAVKAMPGKTLSSIVFPNPILTSPMHYLVWTKGNTAVTSLLFTPALIDAETGKISAIKPLPWYLRTIEVSRPFHFGDYGGLPLKIIWALFDVALIAVLASGIYLWLARRRTPVEDELNRLVRLEELASEQTSTEGVLTR